MKETTKQFLNLFFNEGEKICVSPDEYGYRSVSQDTLDGTIRLVPPPRKDGSEARVKEIQEDQICLVALNPIDGFRRDSNVTAYRSFLVEMDDGTLAEQMKYIEDSGLPYSICVFSGNKSLHFGVVLQEDLVEEYLWRDVAQWILNILTKADPLTKNPSRSIRIPGVIRPNGKGLEQKLVKIKGRVDNEELFVWLNKYPDLNPAEIKKRTRKKVNTGGAIGKIPVWLSKKIVEYDPYMEGRNAFWYWVGRRLAERDYEPDEMLDHILPHFVEDISPNGFLESELETALKSAYEAHLREEGLA